MRNAQNNLSPIAAPTPARMRSGPTRSSITTTTSHHQVPLRPIDERNSWNSTASSPSVAKNRNSSNADLMRVDTPSGAVNASLMGVQTPSHSEKASTSSTSNVSLASNAARSLLATKEASYNEKVRHPDTLPSRESLGSSGDCGGRSEWGCRCLNLRFSSVKFFTLTCLALCVVWRHFEAFHSKYLE